MTIATGAFIQPAYGKPFTPGTANVLTDPAFHGIIDLELIGGQTGSGLQASWTWLPNILHAFYNWKGYSASTPPTNGGTAMDVTGVRYVMFDDTPAVTVTNKQITSNVATLTMAAHNFYTGQFVTVASVGTTFNGTWKVTGTTATTITYTVATANVGSTSASGTVAAAACTNQTTIAAGSNGASLPQSTINVASTTGFPTSGTIQVVTSAGPKTVTYTNTGTTTFTGCSGGTGSMSTGAVVNTPFTNIADTTGLNTTNLGPRRWIDYVQALYTANSASGPPITLTTWRTGGVNSSHNMENNCSWQQNSGVDEFSLSAITSGTHDAFIAAFASQVADYMYANQTYVLQFRLDQECNGNNYGWAYNNQWIDPTTAVGATATPDNGPAMLNGLTQTVSSGNPVSTYGKYALMFQHVITLFKNTVSAQLQNIHGMSSGSATTLMGNLKFVWCLGSGSLITATAGPIANPPWPQLPHTYQAGASAATYVVTNVANAGGNTTLTVTPGTDYVSNAANSYTLTGHGIPVGAAVGPTYNAASPDTVTAVTNTTITFVTGSNTYTTAVALAGVTSYVASCAPWVSLYPGDAYCDLVSMDGYNPGKTANVWKNYWSGSTGGNIFSASYPAYTGFTAKPIQISETGCVEGTTGTPTKAQWITTNLQTGGQLVTNMSAVTQLVYFDQGGRNSGYQVRTSTAAFAQWQALGTDAAWTNLGTLAASPPITTGVPVSIIVTRNNVAATLANETSASVAELAIASDTKQMFLGDGASQFSALPFITFPSVAHLWSGTGVPSAGLGANGDYYFRSDGSSSTTHIYFKSSGSWAGIA